MAQDIIALSSSFNELNGSVVSSIGFYNDGEEYEILMRPRSTKITKRKK